MHKPTAIDLFCGCGGMGLGLEQARFEVLYANDISKDAISTYKANLNADMVECKDVARVNPRSLQRKIGRDVDIIVAGTPCQGFSMLGRRDPGDPRNTMFRHLIRFLRAFNPKMFIMENVAGMLTMRGGSDFSKIRKKLEETGYATTPVTLSASEYGVPQNRKRIFLIGIKGNEKYMASPKPAQRKITVAEAISDLDFLDVGEKSSTYEKPASSTYQKQMRSKSHVLHNHEAPHHSRKIKERFAAIQAGEDWKNMAQTGKRDCHKMDPDTQSRTVTTLPEDYVHYCRSRIPTVRELARLQSFPDWFEFMGPRTTGGSQRAYTCCQYTQVGNAVPPMLARNLFESIMPYLKT